MWAVLYFPGGLGLAVMLWSVLLAPAASIAVSILLWRSNHSYQVLAVTLLGTTVSVLVGLGFATSLISWPLSLLTGLPEWFKLVTVVLILLVTVEILHELGEYETIAVSPVRFEDGVRNHRYRMLRLTVLVGATQFPTLLVAVVILTT